VTAGDYREHLFSGEGDITISGPGIHGTADVEIPQGRALADRQGIGVGIRRRQGPRHRRARRGAHRGMFQNGGGVGYRNRPLETRRLAQGVHGPHLDHIVPVPGGKGKDLRESATRHSGGIYRAFQGDGNRYGGDILNLTAESHGEQMGLVSLRRLRNGQLRGLGIHQPGRRRRRGLRLPIPVSVLTQDINRVSALRQTAKDDGFGHRHLPGIDAAIQFVFIGNNTRAAYGQRGIRLLGR